MTRSLPNGVRFIGCNAHRTAGMFRWSILAALLIAAALALPAAMARQQTIELTGDTWTQPEPGTWRDAQGNLHRLDPVDPDDRAVISRASQQLAENNPRGALATIKPWIKEHELFDNPGLPEALLIRADALTAIGHEWKALYDYEKVLREYPGSDVFQLANEREYEIAERYLEGLRRKFLGLRLFGAEDVGVELLMRIQERMPGSALAERAAIRLGDYFYDQREIKLAWEMYDIYLRNYPTGPNRTHAEKRRIYASLARFKGPRYDASSLIGARLNIEDFARRYPVEAQRTGLNDGMIARIDESQAAHMLDSAEWYIQTKNYPAARLTMQRLIIAHPLTLAAQQARTFMTEQGWEVPTTATPATADDEAAVITGPQEAEIIQPPSVDPVNQPENTPPAEPQP